MCDGPLTLKQEAFCRILAMPDDQGNSVPATIAYLRAFGSNSERSAKQGSQRLLKNDLVSARLEILRADAQRLLKERLPTAGIVSKAKRLMRKNKHWELLCELIEVRAKQFSKEPGADTGLLVATPKQIGGETVEVYQLDKEALDALNELEKSAARELEQLQEGNAVNLTVGQVIVVLPDNGRDRPADVN